MANRYLYLTNTRIACLTLARGRVRDAREFEVSEEGAAALALTVAERMITDVPTCEENDTVAEIMETMTRCRFRHSADDLHRLSSRPIGSRSRRH